MNKDYLQELAGKFFDEMQASDILQGHVREHERRSQRAQRFLTLEEIPELQEDELREIFFDSDAFSFWGNKEWEFNNRIQKSGLDGIKQAILELITRAERGLTPDDLIKVWNMRGLGILLSTELIAYRYPDRYWTYNAAVTLVAFKALGKDIKAMMPHGQKSDPYMYFAIEELQDDVIKALQKAGFSEVNYLLADIFLWWIKTNVIISPDPVDKNIPDVGNETIEQAMMEFDQEKRSSTEWAGWESKVNYRYAIFWNTMHYPVKEIVRMATGAEDFTSQQARAYLSKKGFHVLSLDQETTNVWIFQANPSRYDLLQALKREKYTQWDISRYRNEIKSGDTLVFWKAGENRGIYGLGKTISSPYNRPDGKFVADVEYLGRFDQPIFYTDLVDHPVLSQMHIMRQFQGTNFRVTQDEWEALKPLFGEVIPPDPDAIDTRDEEIHTVPVSQLISRSLRSSGLLFKPWQIATYYTALQTKGFVILSGISGTGKTKLAQHIASLMPRPAEDIKPTEDHIQITVQPYMLKYNRVIIPKAATRFFEPPAPGEFQDVRLSFDEDSENCRLVHAKYSNTDYVQLLLKGSARNWFITNLQEGDTLFLEPQLDAESNLAGFQMMDLKEKSRWSTMPKSSGAENWIFVPVRPDWRDSKSLLGYYNPLTGTYEWTPFLRFIMKAIQSYRDNEQIAWFIILDEMNLARVEYYFADLLSVLESGRDDSGWTREPLHLVYPADAEGDLPQSKVKLPPNLYIIGTVNVDETTYTFSPKVLDRAFTLELTEADFSEYLIDEDVEEFALNDRDRQHMFNDFTFSGQFALIDKQRISAYIQANVNYRNWLQTLNDWLRPYELHFGYRVFDEIIAFLISAEQNQMYEKRSDGNEAFDAAVLMKVLPKFHGSRKKLEEPLRGVLAWCLDPDSPVGQAIEDVLKEDDANIFESLSQLSYKLPKTAERARRMLRSLYTTGFASFG
jgi:5-methylcytosine-specific restriction enzyme B